MTLPSKLAADLEPGSILTPALIAVGTWLEAKATHMLVLQGGTGSGKSLAAGWGYQFVACRNRVQPAWYDAPTIATVLEWKDWSAFDRAPLVVIDDLGTEREPARMTGVLERVFNVAAGRAIVTTNIDIGQAFALYGARMESRLRGSATWITLTDHDYRIVPPTGRQAPLPSAETRGEIAAKRRAAEERRRQEAADEAEAAEATRLGALAREELEKLTQHCSSTERLASDASDNERRNYLRRQVEMLKGDA